MSNQRDMWDLVKRLTGQENVLVVPRLYAEAMGSLDGGVFLSQLLYWSDKGRDGWFAKSHLEWTRETTLSRYEVAKQTKICVDAGFLKTEIRKFSGAPTTHYFLLIAEFQQWIVEKLNNPSASFSTIHLLETEQSYTYPTTAITSSTTRVSVDTSVSPNTHTSFTAKDMARHPAIQIWMEETGSKVTPNVAQMRAVIDHVTDLDKWRQTVKIWVAKDFRIKSVDGMLERYDRGWSDYEAVTNGSKYASQRGRSARKSTNSLATSTEGADPATWITLPD